MEPAVRGARIEPAIVAARLNGRFSLPKRRSPGLPSNIRPSQPCCRERNFWMQRREAEIGLRDRKCHQRPAERNDTGKNPRRNGLFLAGPEICGLVGLDGGAGMDRTANSPVSLSNRSPTSVPGTEFFDAETDGQKPGFRETETAMKTEGSSKSPHSAAQLRQCWAQFDT